MGPRSAARTRRPRPRNAPPEPSPTARRTDGAIRRAAADLSTNCSTSPGPPAADPTAGSPVGCGYAASLGQRKRVAHIPTAETEAERSGLILEWHAPRRHSLVEMSAAAAAIKHKQLRT